MKTRAGLYYYKFCIAPNVEIKYCVQFSPEGIRDFENKWAVSFLITGQKEAEWFDKPFYTKRDAINAICEVQENGHYEYAELYGWCYFDN